MGQHIFISYKHTEQEFADTMMRQLQAAGFKVWIDSEQLRAGENWRETINFAIHDAFALILIISPDSKVSEYVTYEWAFAQGAGIKVIPVMLKRTEKLHPQLEMLQYLDFTDLARPPWDKLIRRLWEVQGEAQPYTVSVARDTPPAVKSSVAALDSPNAEERRDALKTLAQNNHPAAYAALVGAVQHTMRDVRVDAAFMLAKQTNHQDPAAVPGLLDGLNDEDPRIRIAACKELGEIGHASAVPELLRIMTKGTDSNLSWEAVGALGKIGAAAVPGLMEALRDEDWKVRRSAAEAMYAMREPAAVPGLVGALLDKNDVVRQAATGALEAMGDMAVPGLAEALRGRDGYLRQAAADMLKRLNTSAAQDALRQWMSKTTSKLDERRMR